MPIRPSFIPFSQNEVSRGPPVGQSDFVYS